MACLKWLVTALGGKLAKLNLDGVTKQEIVDLLEELYDICSQDPSFAENKKGEVMDRVQLLFIEIGLLVP
jgi:hypothetical protein